MNSILLLLVIAAPSPLLESPGAPLFGGQLSPRLEPVLLWQRGEQLELETRSSTVRVRARAGAFPATGCATEGVWRLVIPARIDGAWHAVELGAEGATQPLPLPGTPLSAVAFEPQQCRAALALADGSVITWEHGGTPRRRPLGRAVADPAEAGRGVLLSYRDDTIFMGSVDARLARSGDAEVALDGRALSAAVWMTGEPGLLVLTSRGSVYLVPAHGPARRLATTGVTARGGLTLWKQGLAWGADDGQVRVLVPGNEVTTVAELGAPVSQALVRLDVLDEGRAQLVGATTDGRLFVVHESLDVEWFPLGGRPLAPLVFDARFDEAVRIFAPVHTTTHVGLQFPALSRPLFCDITAATLAGWPDASALEVPAGATGLDDGWSCRAVPGAPLLDVLLLVLWRLRLPGWRVKR